MLRGRPTIFLTQRCYASRSATLAMEWFDLKNSTLASHFIPVWLDSMTLKNTMPVSPWHHDDYDHFLHFSVWFPASFDVLQETVDQHWQRSKLWQLRCFGWRLRGNCGGAWQCPFWKVISRKAFGNPGLVTHGYHSEGSIPEKTPPKRQFLIRRQGFWNSVVHLIWLTLLLFKKLDTLIQFLTNRDHISIASFPTPSCHPFPRTCIHIPCVASTRLFVSKKRPRFKPRCSRNDQLTCVTETDYHGKGELCEGFLEVRENGYDIFGCCSETCS